MSTTTHDAAKRLRSLYYRGGGDWRTPDGESLDADDIRELKATLADAYLVANPESDAEPITEEWLLDNGFDDKDGCMTIHNGENTVSYLKSIGGFFVQGRGVEIRKTRGVVRTLCRALSIELKAGGSDG